MTIRGLLPFVSLVALTALTGCQATTVNPKTAEQAYGPQRYVTDVRESTAYIDMRPSRETRDMYMNIALDPRVSDPKLKAYIARRGSMGASGSGFAAVNIPGYTLVITNRHVSEGGELVSVSFDRGLATRTTGEFIYVDDKHDVAVIRIPIQRPVARIGNSPPELTKILTIGYPGGDYRITPGVITNSCFKFDHTLGAKSDCWLQHDAASDPGSSGGPVVAGDTVVGIHTMSFRDRTLMKLAVPGEFLREALLKAAEVSRHMDDAKWRGEKLRNTCQRFTDEIGSAYADSDAIMGGISPMMISSIGQPAFMTLDPVKRLLGVAYYGVDETIKFAIHEILRKQIAADGGIKDNGACGRINSNDNLLDSGTVVRIRLGLEKRSREVLFRFERGSWRMVGMDIDKDLLKPYVDSKSDDSSDDESESSSISSEASAVSCPPDTCCDKFCLPEIYGQ